MGTDILSSTERRGGEGRRKKEQVIVEHDAEQRAGGVLDISEDLKPLEVKVWAESTVAYDAVAVPMGHV